jgi:hypothetical protein
LVGRKDGDVRGGLDDALDKLARRDELRRRAAGEANGTSPAVQELVEAIAAVVARNPKLGVTVGVEGAGDPVLVHFAVEDGVVQVNVDNSVASRVAEAGPTSPRHADFDIDLDEPQAAASFSEPTPTSPSASAFFAEPAPAPSREPADAGQETHRISYDDHNRYDPGTGYTPSGYAEPADTPTLADPYAERRYDGHRRYDDDLTEPGLFSESPVFPPVSPGTASFLSQEPHPFAVTPPPPVPPQTPSRPAHAEQHRAPEEHAARDRIPEQRGMPAPLPKPIPLKIDGAETELAARRLSALLRDNPSLLQQSPPE